MREAGHATVMVVNNDEDTRFLLRFWLEAEGYSVVEAADGQEAVELTLGKCPDLILMSERMPKLGGLEAPRRTRRQGKECFFPIVAMSTYPTTEAQEAAITAGCDSFVPQPVSLEISGVLLSRLLRVAAGGHREAARAALPGRIE